jgi:hypothetical protein
MSSNQKTIQPSAVYDPSSTDQTQAPFSAQVQPQTVSLPVIGAQVAQVAQQVQQINPVATIQLPLIEVVQEPIMNFDDAKFKIRNIDRQHPYFKNIEMDLKNSDESIEVVSIQKVYSNILEQKFGFNRQLFFQQNIDNNPTILYHVTKGDILSICKEGLDIRMAKPGAGLFGKGIYFTDNPSKANQYSPKRGFAHVDRYMLRCTVILGRVKNYGIGRFDKDLVREPDGFNSVKGYVRHANEYVIYNNSQCCISEIIRYRVTNVQNELTLPVAQNVPGSIVHVTASLSEFFGNMEKRANGDVCKIIQIKKHIGSMLKQEITPAEFLTFMTSILQQPPPADLYERLVRELAKCRLNIIQNDPSSANPNANHIKMYMTYSQLFNYIFYDPQLHQPVQHVTAEQLFGINTDSPAYNTRSKRRKTSK